MKTTVFIPVVVSTTFVFTAQNQLLIPISHVKHRKRKLYET